MTIATIELSQQQSYQQSTKQSQKVTLLTPAKPEQSNNTIAPPEPVLLDTFSTLQSSGLSPSQSEVEEITYEKPKALKLQLMVLVLERFLGRELDISDFAFHTASNDKANSYNRSSNEVFSIESIEQININGQLFRQGDLLSVEEWQSHEQQLNYQVQGKFNINDNELSLNYNFALSSKRTSYSKIEMSAAALKDPLIVQFGSQGLGDIKGQKDFAINQDDTLDNLPIFSGDVGYLVYDKNNNQQADNGSELFGPKTGQGFAELALLDSNKNGFIDAEDQQFEQLFLWQPSDEDEQTAQWISLKDAKIQAISLSAINTPFDFYDQHGQIQAQLRQSSFAISDDGYGRGVHQVDVRI